MFTFYQGGLAKAKIPLSRFLATGYRTYILKGAAILKKYISQW